MNSTLTSVEQRSGTTNVLDGKKIVVVMPAYNAARTLRQTYEDLPFDIVDEVLLVDDRSSDETVTLARELNVTTFQHKKNLGYGRNQKTCYREALKRGADIVVMLHPDYQYSPKLVTSLAGMIASGHYEVALGSRILGVGALQGGMPRYKYISTGFRAFSRCVLGSLPLEENSDDFRFDNEMLAQAIYFNHQIGEISCPTKYFPEASSISFKPSVKYGFGVLWTSLKFRMQKMGLARFRLFDSERTRPLRAYYEELSK
jgi:glycosyltransferase involved in cell wall biosynthesis